MFSMLHAIPGERGMVDPEREVPQEINDAYVALKKQMNKQGMSTGDFAQAVEAIRQKAVAPNADGTEPVREELEKRFQGMPDGKLKDLAMAFASGYPSMANAPYRRPPEQGGTYPAQPFPQAEAVPLQQQPTVQAGYPQRALPSPGPGLPALPGPEARQALPAPEPTPETPAIREPQTPPSPTPATETPAHPETVPVVAGLQERYPHIKDADLTDLARNYFGLSAKDAKTKKFADRNSLLDFILGNDAGRSVLDSLNESMNPDKPTPEIQQTAAQLEQAAREDLHALADARRIAESESKRGRPGFDAASFRSRIRKALQDAPAHAQAEYATEGPAPPSGPTGAGGGVQPPPAAGPADQGATAVPPAPGNVLAPNFIQVGRRLQLPVHYGLEELSDVVPSHQVNAATETFRRTEPEKYNQKLQPTEINKHTQSMIVEQGKNLQPWQQINTLPSADYGPPVLRQDTKEVLSGNKRTMMLQVAASRPGGLDGYRQYLIQHAAEFGLDPSKIAKMNQPTLVRYLDVPKDSDIEHDFTIQANQSTATQQTTRKIGFSLSHLITRNTIEAMHLSPDDTFSEASSGPRGRQFREIVHNELLNTIGHSSIGSYFNDDMTFTSQGKDVAKYMLLGKVFPEELVNRLGEADARIEQCLEKSIPQLLSMQSTPKTDFNSQLRQALEVLGRNPWITDKATANDALENTLDRPAESVTPAERMLLHFVADNMGATKKFSDGLRNLGAVLRGEEAKKDTLFPEKGGKPKSLEDQCADALGLEMRDYYRNAYFGDPALAGKATKGQVDEYRTMAKRSFQSPAQTEEGHGAIEESAAEAETGVRYGPEIERLERGTGEPTAQQVVDEFRRQSASGTQPAGGAGYSQPISPRLAKFLADNGIDFGPTIGGTAPRPGVTPGPAGTAAQPPGSPANAPISQYDIIATVRRLFNLPIYQASELQASADALYRYRPQAAEVNKMQAGNAPVVTHELAHHLYATLGLPIKPGDLTTEQFSGFKSMDYWPERSDAAQTAREGFAEWLRMYCTNQLPAKMTANEQAADKYARSILSNVMPQIDRVKDLFNRYSGQPAAQQFGGLTSATGKPAQPVVTPGERAVDYLQATREGAYDRLLDDLGPVKRAEAAAKGKGWQPERGTTPSEVMANIRFRAQPMANLMEQSGVFYYDRQTGREVQLGRGFQEIVKDFSASEMKDLETYMHARQADYEAAQGRAYLPQEQIDLARATLREFASNPAQEARMRTAADAVTNEVFNASLDAMVQAGRLKQDFVDWLKKTHPYYLSADVVKDEESFLSMNRRGDQPRSAWFLKERTGSGEQRIGLLDAVRNRLNYTAYTVGDQAKFDALVRLSMQEGVGPWMNPGMIALKAGEEVPVGWQKGKAENVVTGYQDGDRVGIAIKDKALYDLYTGMQGEEARKFFYGLQTVAKPFAGLTRVFRTALSGPWHARNIFRDPYLYLSRNEADRNVIQDAGTLAQWWGKSMGFYWTQMWNPKAAAGDIYFRLYEQMAGRELQSTAGVTPGSMSSPLQGWAGIFRRVSDFATSFETGTRVLAMKDRLDNMGLTREWLESEEAKDPDQRNPIPFAAQVACLDAAGQIAHNVHQMGYWVREANKAVPFLGAHVAGWYKDISNFREQPLKALRVVGLLAAAKAVEWLLNRNDPDYQDRSPAQRNGFVFKTPMGWMKLPAPRGVYAPILGLMDYTMGVADKANPSFAGLLQQQFQGMLPEAGPEPWNTAAHLLANRTSILPGGRPIVSEHQQRIETPAQQAIRQQLPYAATQLTGGLYDPHAWTTNPFGMGAPHQSLNDFYDRFNTLSNQFTSNRAQNTPDASVNQEYHRLEMFHTRMVEIEKAKGLTNTQKLQMRTELARKAMSQR
jgi:hypothetical protein